MRSLFVYSLVLAGVSVCCAQAASPVLSGREQLESLPAVCGTRPVAHAVCPAHYRDIASHIICRFRTVSSVVEPTSQCLFFKSFRPSTGLQLPDNHAVHPGSRIDRSGSL